MRAIIVAICFIICAFVHVKAKIVMTSNSEASNEQLHHALVFVPLLQGESIIIWQVPTMIAPGLDGLVEVMACPVYPTVASAGTRRQNINAISLSGIGLKLLDLENGAYDLVIDLSTARPPPGSKVGLRDVVQATLDCLRIHLSGTRTRVNIKVRGKDDVELRELEGALWGGV